MLDDDDYRPFTYVPGEAREAFAARIVHDMQYMSADAQDAFMEIGRKIAAAAPEDMERVQAECELMAMAFNGRKVN